MCQGGSIREEHFLLVAGNMNGHLWFVAVARLLKMANPIHCWLVAFGAPGHLLRDGTRKYQNVTMYVEH